MLRSPLHRVYSYIYILKNLFYRNRWFSHAFKIIGLFNLKKKEWQKGRNKTKMKKKKKKSNDKKERRMEDRKKEIEHTGNW